jgi:hypothetical protein
MSAGALAAWATVEEPLKWRCHLLWATTATPAHSAVQAEWRAGLVQMLRFNRHGQLMALVYTTTPRRTPVLRLVHLDSVALESSEAHPCAGH